MKPDEGLTALDKYLYTNDDNVKAGMLLAMGITNSGVRDECDWPMVSYLNILNQKIVNPFACSSIVARYRLLW